MSERDDMRSELIQTAAVAVAIVEDLDYGMTGLTVENRRDVLHDVGAERVLQDIKWGPRHHTPMEWLAILGEEVGEACKAALESHDWPARQQRVFDGEVSDE